MIKVIINGAKGRVGREICRTIGEQEGMIAVGMTGASDNLGAIIQETKADVVIEFTRAEFRLKNTLTILESGARPVVGTSGFTAEEVADIRKIANRSGIGGIIAPNFSIGAVLMMKFAALAAKYFQHAEIIELHHDKKADFPSGTAIRTAELIASTGERFCNVDGPQRGVLINGVRTHSIRLPGLLAHQEVIFGGTGETFTLRSDCISRECFLDGIYLAVREVMKRNELYYGLESFLD
jgi:4-hydroxy-tetrahydrodipicolinate reductase